MTAHSHWEKYFQIRRIEYRQVQEPHLLPSRRSVSPDFCCPEIGWIFVADNKDIYDEKLNVKSQFSLFYEFVSTTDQWCYWLGGAMPYFDLHDLDEYLSPDFNHLEGDAYIHKCEMVHKDWHSYVWYKIKRHGSSNTLIKHSSDAGPAMARLVELGQLKTSNLHLQDFRIFLDKKALFRARSIESDKVSKAIR